MMIIAEVSIMLQQAFIGGSCSIVWSPQAKITEAFTPAIIPAFDRAAAAIF